MATPVKFLAAARTMVGPPMSMFSMASSSLTPRWATVASNGYRFTTTRSMGLMPRSAMACRWAGLLAVGQDAAVDVGMQGLDPAVHDLGEAR